MTRQEVFALVDQEREHQDNKWGTVRQHPHEVGGWLTIMRVYLQRAEAGWLGDLSDGESLAEVRKVAALAVACLEQHG